jgi:hypothetical protein
VTVDEEAFVPGDPRPMSDAEAAFAERLAADLERVLGAGIAIDDIELRVDDGRAVAHAVLLIEGRVVDLDAEADDVLGLYTPLMQAAASARLAGAFWRMVGPA